MALELFQGARRKEADRKIARSAQTRWRFQNCGYGIDGYRGRSDIAVRAVGNNQADVWMASEFDGIGGILGAYVKCSSR